MKRRQFLGLGAAASVAALAACSNGTNSGGGSSGGVSQVRYGHWDNGSAQALYAALFQKFMDANEDIEILQEFASYDAFQERMTTQIAGGEVADIFWIASPQILAYNQAGIYHDVEGLPGFDFDSLDADMLDRLKIDGKLNTLPVGMITPCFRYNQTFLDELGAEAPSVWSWDSTAEFLRDYTNNNPDGNKGIFYHAGHDLTLEAWLRQHGEDLWTEDGQLGASIDGIASYLDWWEQLRLDEVTLSVEEQGGIQGAWNEFGSKVLSDIGSHNQILEASLVFPDFELREVPTPVLEDAADGHAFTYFVRVGVYEGVPEDRLEAVGRVLDFNLNSEEFITELGPVQGTPASLRQRTALEGTDDPNIQQANSVTDAVLAQEMRPRYDAPPNASTWRREYDAAIEQVVLGQASITDAVTQFHSTVSGSL
ncbi:ABC transporter substrate-binding protein [Occultella gossypii]|uniref:Carbohydrate ABC transporter substrate-binding protein n=1 Tax=Occultella gossypii TaxID=2800820 RepID=A0ABS7SC50_9MICO|nr:ABC transporter substrate-binding protein [Occultella gossypii]MBZ2197943.1 carbohydrate ABC transporter substrate-binding protein [Occultella gossypii]